MNTLGQKIRQIRYNDLIDALQMGKGNYCDGNPLVLVGPANQSIWDVTEHCWVPLIPQELWKTCCCIRTSEVLREEMKLAEKAPLVYPVEAVPAEVQKEPEPKKYIVCLTFTSRIMMFEFVKVLFDEQLTFRISTGPELIIEETEGNLQQIFDLCLDSNLKITITTNLTSIN